MESARILVPTINGAGILLPKDREIVLSELSVPRFHKGPKHIAGIGGKFPKFQRGSISFAAGVVDILAGGSTIPLVSNIIISDSTASGLINVGITFNESTVGSVEELVKRHFNSVYSVMGDDDAGSPVDHTGEWTSDTVTASAWEVACTSEDIGTWDTPHAAVTVYTTFATSNMNWLEHRPGGKSYTPGTDRCVGTFRIREVADTANNDDFTVDVSAIQT